MESTSSILSTAKMIMDKGKRGAAALINAELSKSGGSNTQKNQNLEALLHVILNLGKAIDDSENIEWCKWLIAGGRSPAEFSSIGNVVFFIRYFSCYFTASFSSMQNIELLLNQVLKK